MPLPKRQVGPSNLPPPLVLFASQILRHQSFDINLDAPRLPRHHVFSQAPSGKPVGGAFFPLGSLAFVPFAGGVV